MNCPTCGKPIKWEDNPTRPFCSERCKLIDFGRWANEEYRVPVAEIPLAENEAAPTLPPATHDEDEQR
ncbi:MAG TPA: DNA gyrase inhibitor YacG [Pyrinomonadaceae bacterium]